MLSQKQPQNKLAHTHLRVGTITTVEEFPEAEKLMYKLWVDFGPKLGIKATCSQITNYPKEELLGIQIFCMTGVNPMKVGSFISEVIVCGCYRHDGSVVLMTPLGDIPNGYSLST